MVILPEINQDNSGYWEAAKKHILVIQRCRDCKRLRHPPGPMCSVCQSMKYEWVRVSGRGKIYSYTICYSTVHPALREKVPYGVVLVELEEGVRVVSNVVDSNPEALKIGLSVEVVFDDVTPDVTLPKFRLIC